MIKVCGMRDAENIREVERLFTQDSSLFTQDSSLPTLHSSLPTFWMGFIFWPKSSRYVAEPPAYLPERAKRVGVFVDEDVEQICRIARDFALDVIQLHGHESPDFIRRLQCSMVNGQCSMVNVQRSMVKAFNIATASDLEQTKAYEGLVDYFLFDTKATLPGGSGQQFDWSILEAYKGETPFLLSGGIGPDDAERVKSFRHPRCAGIDLNSRFEVAPALKDVKKLKEFLEKIQE
jgi:phosphoribosylanthranilate isomerase